ncbi:hypothetical protein E1B28_007484 [Marasmius oreades]|uniref:Uncharacterized protein n=1 Tax=Marasmius oreades TaxID=181124 RepID=A0A9P7UU31_9AGAR|nr:uncharacterized protein E1B28_007484 [Marasmius oreades]KAG7093845.1 hypothetical protein E1B28_007484 [Marasmius oreades]
MQWDTHMSISGPALSYEPLKGTTNVKTPPNYEKFDGFVNPDLIPQPSLIQQRKFAQAQARKQVEAAPPPIIIHNHLPNLHHPGTAISDAQPVHAASTINGLLLPSVAHLSGQPLMISQFCEMFSLHENVSLHLQEHSFASVGALRQVTMADMKEMGFKFGEIAEIQEALKQWVKENHWTRNDV